MPGLQPRAIVPDQELESEVVDEIRWGDSGTSSLHIPAGSTTTVTTPIMQLGDVRVPRATVWSVLIGLEWVNKDAFGAIGDTLTLDAFLRVGVGSTEWATFRLIDVPGPGPLSTDDAIVDAIPATRLYLSLRLRVEVPVAGVDRTYVGRYTLLAAPYSALRLAV